MGVKETKKHPPRSSQISAVSSKYSLPSRFKSQPCVSTVSFSCKTQNDENPNHKSTPCKGRQGCPPDDRPDASGTSEKDARDKSKRWAPQRERDRSWGKRARGDRLEERQKKGSLFDIRWGTDMRECVEIPQVSASETAHQPRVVRLRTGWLVVCGMEATLLGV